MIWSALKLPLFCLPAESAHHLGVKILKVWGMMPLTNANLNYQYRSNQPNLFGAMNPVGLAAGFDKNCEVLESLPSFGFGFAEIGTVTPKPQGGNELPRLFRDIAHQNLFNRMGFNNLGAGIISARLAHIKPKLPLGFKVGVNLGKNKSTPDDQAAQDYASVAFSFLDTADYYVINVSSPNTPGLRALQAQENLLPIVRSVQSVVNTAKKNIPIYVKLAPELDVDTLKKLIHALEGAGINGLVLTNTLNGTHIYRGKTFSGGWSGPILQKQSLESLKTARSVTFLPIISVGGIDSVENALERFSLGAQAIQIYTSWIFNGPFFPRTIGKSICGQFLP